VAQQKDIEFSYTLTDKVIRLALGDMADFSGAKYDGDFSMSLDEAQHRKHEYVAERIGLEPGDRVLDLGCGWGALLNHIRERGGTGVGVTLSTAQRFLARRLSEQRFGCVAFKQPGSGELDSRQVRYVERASESDRIRESFHHSALETLHLGRWFPTLPTAPASAENGRSTC
jgi:cyclopropane fatty-acyl-phospholipid synthase-like methyltransferase